MVVFEHYIDVSIHKSTTETPDVHVNFAIVSTLILHTTLHHLFQFFFFKASSKVVVT